MRHPSWENELVQKFEENVFPDKRRCENGWSPTVYGVWSICQPRPSPGSRREHSIKLVQKKIVLEHSYSSTSCGRSQTNQDMSLIKLFENVVARNLKHFRITKRLVAQDRLKFWCFASYTSSIPTFMTNQCWTELYLIKRCGALFNSQGFPTLKQPLVLVL